MLRINKTNTDINLIVALGNMGKSYAKSRHNAGFLFAAELAKHFEKIGLEKKCETTALYKLTEYDELDLRILEPSTMMNNSGQAVIKYIKMHEGVKFKPLLLLVHDDLDLKFGEYKIQFGKSPKMHNGITSVENSLGGNKDFWRLRIGVDCRNPRSRETGLEYVLQNFSSIELKNLNELFEKIISTEFSVS